MRLKTVVFLFAVGLISAWGRPSPELDSEAATGKLEKRKNTKFHFNNF